jgi:mono/diheme cytochrome c family protein
MNASGFRATLMTALVLFLLAFALACAEERGSEATGSEQVREAAGLQQSADAESPEPPSGDEPADEAAPEDVSEAAPEDAGEPHPGRQVFIDNNCALCHTAYAFGLGETPEEWKPEPGESILGDGNASGAPPDLSVLVAAWTSELLSSYLVERVEVGGSKHVTSFSGGEQEWAELSEWLLAARAAPDSTGDGDTPEAGETE